MSETDPRLTALRASLAAATFPRGAQVPLGHLAADACLEGGLRLGALHEIFAAPGHEAAATGFVAALCGRVAAKKTVLWIRPQFSAIEAGEIAALGWLDLGLDPARLLLLRVSDATSLLRAGQDALSCAALGAVVMECLGASRDFSLTASQRLILESARTGVTAFWLRFSAAPQSSAAETRWQVKALRSRTGDPLWGKPAFDIVLERNRHGRTAAFALEWNRDHGVFQSASDGPSRAQSVGSLVSAPADRPGASAGQSLQGAAGTGL